MIGKMILFGIVVALLVIGVLMYKKPTFKIVEVRDFSCPGMTGFTFKYPVFKGWDMVAPEQTGEGTCQIWFSKTGIINFEMQPKIFIENTTEAKYTKHEMPYTINQDASEIQFFGGDFEVVSITTFLHEGDGYSNKKFIETVVKSFKWL